MRRSAWLLALVAPLAAQQYRYPHPKDRMPPWFRAYLKNLPRDRKDELARYFSGDSSSGPSRDIYEVIGR
jgi:hypothetical protein